MDNCYNNTHLKKNATNNHPIPIPRSFIVSEWASMIIQDIMNVNKEVVDNGVTMSAFLNSFANRGSASGIGYIHLQHGFTVGIIKLHHYNCQQFGW